jgi:glycosyltransferase involved in cell wall biosynthesis
MKFGYFGFPHIGGTYSVYRQLRGGLAGMGVELVWIGTGANAHRAAADPAWAQEMAHGLVVGRPGDSEDELGRAVVRAVTAGGFEGVFANVFADRVQMNAARYLPAEIRRIMIVHSTTPATYSAARSIRDSVHATACVSRRIRDDLVGRFGFDPAWTQVINNAVETAPAPRPRQHSPGELRLLFLGRIEDQAKGVLWLPAILGQLPDNVTLTVAGTGPDLPRLVKLCAGLGERVRFLGAVSPDEVPALLSAHDVLIAPSRYEGFMIALVEAMARGCVPVASRIGGVTDAIVEHGNSGLLFPIGDTAAAARCIARLLANPSVLERMSLAGPETVARRFTVERMAADYLDLIHRVRGAPRPLSPALDVADWRMPARLRPGLRTYLPLPVKNLLRTMRERLAT